MPRSLQGSDPQRDYTEHKNNNESRPETVRSPPAIQSGLEHLIGHCLRQFGKFQAAGHASTPTRKSSPVGRPRNS